MGPYRQWQISQSCCEINCNCGKNLHSSCLFNACERLGRQTSAGTKPSARLKIAFVDMTYLKGWTLSVPSFSLGSIDQIDQSLFERENLIIKMVFQGVV